ncbi:hypothetical protein EJ03DRAFT_352653 [Teratosphaeria nubilosa]|uniref:Uncharacterized protein n=1 Tax=Teratosphaeria nubilosa TaxID=161662 RepID=A0A6G1L5R6_9PEZI|nr:hypothetical protein EJ03DRAFT_352653 [Teratosphaeria nubilosa]
MAVLMLKGINALMESDNKYVDKAFEPIGKTARLGGGRKDSANGDQESRDKANDDLSRRDSRRESKRSSHGGSKRSSREEGRRSRREEEEEEGRGSRDDGRAPRRRGGSPSDHRRSTRDRDRDRDLEPRRSPRQDRDSGDYHSGRRGPRLDDRSPPPSPRTRRRESVRPSRPSRRDDGRRRPRSAVY